MAGADGDGNWETLRDGNEAEEDEGDDGEPEDSDGASNSELESVVVSIVESVVNNTHERSTNDNFGEILHVIRLLGLEGFSLGHIFVTTKFYEALNWGATQISLTSTSPKDRV